MPTQHAVIEHAVIAAAARAMTDGEVVVLAGPARPTHPDLHTDVLDAEPRRFWRAWLREAMAAQSKQEGSDPCALADLQAMGAFRVLITTCMHGIYERYGVMDPVLIRGTAGGAYCRSCGESFGSARVALALSSADAPRCGCGCILTPSALLPGAEVQGASLRPAWEAIESAAAVVALLGAARDEALAPLINARLETLVIDLPGAPALLREAVRVL